LIYEALELDLTATVFGISARRGTCGEPPSVGLDNVAVGRGTENQFVGRKSGRCPGIVSTDGILVGLGGVAASIGERGIWAGRVAG